MKGEKIIAFLKIAGPTFGLGAFAQKTWDEHKNNNVDIGIKKLGIEHSQLDLDKKKEEYKIHNFQEKLKLYENSISRINNIEDKVMKDKFYTVLSNSIFTETMNEINLTEVIGEIKTHSDLFPID